MDQFSNDVKERNYNFSRLSYSQKLEQMFFEPFSVRLTSKFPESANMTKNTINVYKVAFCAVLNDFQFLHFSAEKFFVDIFLNFLSGYEIGMKFVFL